jgi:hypothetical protein
MMPKFTIPHVDRISSSNVSYVNTQNYRVFGPFPSSGILENTTFRKLDLFPSSGEGGGEDTYSVGPLVSITGPLSDLHSYLIT